MKKLICNVEIFDLYQKIQVADTETGEVNLLTEVIRDDLEETLATLSYKHSIPYIVLSGYTGFGEQLAKDIIEYSKTTYGINETNLEIEVI